MTVEFLFISDFGLLHPSVVFLTVEMAVALALDTLNQLLLLFLVAHPMKLTIVCITMAVNRGRVTNGVLIEVGWEVFRLTDLVYSKVLMHVS